jgi:excisionase family DNA binding protein
MTTLRSQITGRVSGDLDLMRVTSGASGDLEPLAVSPRQACQLLNIGQTSVWALIRTGELETYREGRARKITLRSIRARHERQLAAAHGATEIAQPRRRGRPRKTAASEVRR